MNVPQFVVELCDKLGDFYGKMSGHYSLVNSQKVTISNSCFWIYSPEKVKKEFGFNTFADSSKGRR